MSISKLAAVFIAVSIMSSAGGLDMARAAGNVAGDIRVPARVIQPVHLETPAVPVLPSAGLEPIAPAGLADRPAPAVAAQPAAPARAATVLAEKAGAAVQAMRDPGSNTEKLSAAGERMFDNLRPAADQAREFAGRLRSKIIAQDDAVGAMVRTWRRAVSRPVGPGKPIERLLLLGPSGTGKTRLAEAAGQALGGSAGATIRIDASQIREEHEVAGLRDFLTQEELDRHRDPKHGVAIVLFDEVDKASSALWGLVRGLLDKGEPAPGEEPRADFSKTIIVMTANRRVAQMDGLIGPDEEVIFKPLSRAAAGRILETKLEDVKSRLAPLELEVTPKAKAFIAREGFDPRFGARKLAAAFESLVTLPLARMLASGGLAQGDSVGVDVNAAGDGLVYLRNPGSSRPLTTLGVLASAVALGGTPHWTAVLALALGVGAFLLKAYLYSRPSAPAREYARVHGGRIRAIPGVVTVAAKTRTFAVSQYSESVDSGVEVRYALGADPEAIEKALPPAGKGFRLWLKPAFSRGQAATDYVRANKDAVLRLPGVSGMKVVRSVVPTGEFSDSVDIFVEVRLESGADAVKVRAQLPAAGNGVVVRVY